MPAADKPCGIQFVPAFTRLKRERRRPGRMPAPPVVCRLQRGGDPLVAERLSNNGKALLKPCDTARGRASSVSAAEHLIEANKVAASALRHSFVEGSIVGICFSFSFR